MDFSGKSQNAISIQTHPALKILFLRIESHLSTFQQVGNLKVYCFMQELIKKGANVSQCNKLEETPIDRAKVNNQNMFKGTASMIMFTKLYMLLGFTIFYVHKCCVL